MCVPETFLTKTVSNLSIQSEKTNPSILCHVILLNQSKLVIIQACNRRNHEAFQLTDIFPFTNHSPRDYTHFFHNHRYTYFSTFTLSQWCDTVWVFCFSIHYSSHPWIPPSLVPYFRIPALPLSLSHSPDSGCVGTRRATFLDRFLV